MLPIPDICKLEHLHCMQRIEINKKNPERWFSKPDFSNSNNSWCFSFILLTVIPYVHQMLIKLYFIIVVTLMVSI